MTHNAYLRTAAIIFLIIFALHMLRIIYGWEAQIGDLRIPLWASWVAVMIAGFLSVYGFRLSSRK